LGNHSPEGPERGTNNVVFNTPFPNGENTDMTIGSLDIPKTDDELLCSRKEAAELVGISAQTLINYRNHGIVFSTQNGRGQLFSAKDIKWLRCLRKMIHINTNYIVRLAATQEKI
jgi:MerR-like DNA binding protein